MLKSQTVEQCVVVLLVEQSDCWDVFVQRTKILNDARDLGVGKKEFRLILSHVDARVRNPFSVVMLPDHFVVPNGRLSCRSDDISQFVN